MVGTRHPTPYGTGMAERLACDLAARGLSLSAGWRAASIRRHIAEPISAKGKTVAILGTGIDVMYPKGKYASGGADACVRRRA